MYLDECIDCAACESACPVTAIYHEDSLPDEWRSCIDKNSGFTRNL